MFPAKSLKPTFYFSSVEYKTEIKSSSEKKKQNKLLRKLFVLRSTFSLRILAVKEEERSKIYLAYESSWNYLLPNIS